MKNKTALKGGTYSIVLTTIVLAILVVVNIFAQALPSSVTQYDISSTKLYSITSNTKVVVNALEEDVTIYWVVQNGKEDDVMEKLLDKYDTLSDHIKIKKKNPDILFHVDAIQAYGKLPIYPKKMNIDLLSVIGHKIHGPKGIGFIYINEKAKVKPIIFGGGQQKDMRSGTENVPGIAGLALASKMIYQDLELKTEHMRELKTHFIDCISQIGNVKVHGLTDEGSAPHIVSAGFAGVRSEVLLHTLEDRGICVSAGSACASNHPAISGVLQAIGTPREYLDSTLRFSLSEFTTKEEIDYTLETLYNCIPMLRKYTRR